MKAPVEKSLDPKFQLIWTCLWKTVKDFFFEIIQDNLYSPSMFSNICISAKVQPIDLKLSP